MNEVHSCHFFPLYCFLSLVDEAFGPQCACFQHCPFEGMEILPFPGSLLEKPSSRFFPSAPEIP